MQTICISLQTDNTPGDHRSIFTGRMLFLTLNQQRQSTEGKVLMLLERSDMWMIGVK